MTFSTRIFARRNFPIADFELPSLDFDPACADEHDELLLDRVVASLEGEPNVVSLKTPLPTPGELRNSIERHLRARTAVPWPVAPDTDADTDTDAAPAHDRDAAEELRSALAKLKRSLG